MFFLSTEETVIFVLNTKVKIRIYYIQTDINYYTCINIKLYFNKI